MEWLRETFLGASRFSIARGPGHLAGGLAQAGFAVTATDASPAMTARTAALATDHGVEVATATQTWEGLSRRGWQDRFAAVFCVGNSLAHAAGSDARRQALANMRAVLAVGGRLVLSSRNWELVRGAGSRIAVADSVIERRGRRGVPIHTWVLGKRWGDRHDLYVAGVLLHHDERVDTVAEHLAFWPFRHDELLEDLAYAGLRVEQTTYDPAIERYLITALCED